MNDKEMNFFARHAIFFSAVLYVVIGILYAVAGELLHPGGDISVLHWSGFMFWMPIILVSWPLMVLFGLFLGGNRGLVEGIIQLVIIFLIIFGWAMFIRRERKKAISLATQNGQSETNKETS